MRVTAQMVHQCQVEDDSWSLGNAVLYDLCRVHPHHTSVREVVAKVWLIGRAYSAAVERGRGQVAGPGLSNDAFYTDALAPALIASQLDAHLRPLDGIARLSSAAAEPILAAHGYLVAELSTLTGKDKRSFASKYLHFHCPSLFFIYDSRATTAIRALRIRRTRATVVPGVDAEYAAFVSALFSLREDISHEFGVLLSPRQLDRLLLMVDAA